jgi:hypothetical protein
MQFVADCDLFTLIRHNSAQSLHRLKVSHRSSGSILAEKHIRAEMLDDDGRDATLAPRLIAALDFGLRSPMEPLVLQLQAECLDSRVSILEVLRKALVVARKLSLTSAQSWIERELNGYKAGDNVPPHRLLTGQIRAWNPHHGWIPMMFGDAREATYLATCVVVQPVGELEELAKQAEGNL